MNTENLDPFEDVELPADFGEEPNFSPAAVPASAPVKGGGVAELASKLGIALSPADLNSLRQLGEILGLCKDDALWALILLQMRAGASFDKVPDAVAKIIEESATEAKEATRKMARAEIETAVAESARTTKKEILRALSMRDENKIEMLSLAKNIFIALTLIAVSFSVGNTMYQFTFFKNLAKLIYGE